LKATRSNLPYLIAAAGGALLFIFMFVSWLGAGDTTRSAWGVFTLADIVLAILALATVAVAGAHAMGATLPVTWLRPQLLKWFAVIALTITLTLLIELSSGDLGQADIQIGGWISILACLAMVAGAVLADRPDLTARVADAAGVDDDRPAAQPPAGLGTTTSSTTAAPPAAGAVADPPTSVQPSSAAAGGAPAATPPGAAPAAGAAAGPPAGWYPDPQGQARLRYWDGAAWTEQTQA
jgi:hypothetical protein